MSQFTFLNLAVVQFSLLSRISYKLVYSGVTEQVKAGNSREP